MPPLRVQRSVVPALNVDLWIQIASCIAHTTQFVSGDIHTLLSLYITCKEMHVAVLLQMFLACKLSMQLCDIRMPMNPLLLGRTLLAARGVSMHCYEQRHESSVGYLRLGQHDAFNHLKHTERAMETHPGWDGDEDYAIVFGRHFLRSCVEFRHDSYGRISRRHFGISFPDAGELSLGYIAKLCVLGQNGIVVTTGHESVHHKVGDLVLLRHGDVVGFSKRQGMFPRLELRMRYVCDV